MADQNEHAEVSLLFSEAVAPRALFDHYALQAMLDRMGHAVECVDVREGEFVHLICERLHVLVAGFDKPFPMEHFRGVSRPCVDAERQREVLEMLAAHRSSLTVLVMERSEYRDLAGDCSLDKVCAETVDLLLAETTPDLVFWSDTDLLVTTQEAIAGLDGPDNDVWDQAPAEPDFVQPQRPMGSTTPRGVRPPGFPPPPQSGDIDLGGTEFQTEAFSVRPRKPARSACRTARPAYLGYEPQLSPDMLKWFDGDVTAEDTEPHPSRKLDAFRAFLALDDSPEPRRIAETASGRASLYLMSATIAVFALPVGASMLTYNALSGGSFRATSHMMALTGIGLALTSMGLPNPAAALGFGH